MNQSVKTATPTAATQAPQITSGDPQSIPVNQSASFPLTATGTPTPTFSAGQCPKWVSVDEKGVLTIEPQATAQTQACAVIAKNGVQPDASKSLTIHIVPANTPNSPFVTDDTINAVVGFRVSFEVASSSGSAFTYMVSPGKCSTWLTIDKTTGVLSGTPTASETSTCTVTATPSNQTPPATKVIKVTVTQPRHLRVELNYSVH